MDAVRDTIRSNRYEPVKVVAGESVGDVGLCERCSGDLIGFPTADGYVNRLCSECGKWHRCASKSLDKLHTFDPKSELVRTWQNLTFDSVFKTQTYGPQSPQVVNEIRTVCEQAAAIIHRVTPVTSQKDPSTTAGSLADQFRPESY